MFGMLCVAILMAAIPLLFLFVLWSDIMTYVETKHGSAAWTTFCVAAAVGVVALSITLSVSFRSDFWLEKKAVPTTAVVEEFVVKDKVPSNTTVCGYDEKGNFVTLSNVDIETYVNAKNGDVMTKRTETRECKVLFVKLKDVSTSYSLNEGGGQ